MIDLYQAGKSIFVKLAYDYRLTADFIHAIPGSNYDKSTKMYCIQEIYLEQLLYNIHSDDFIAKDCWSPDTPMIVGHGELENKVQEVLDKWKHIENLRTGKNIKEKYIPDYLKSRDLAPRPYQVSGARFLASIKKAILALKIGGGKSITLLSALKILRQQEEFSGAVLFCPASIKFLTWEQELIKWGGFSYVIVDGNKAQRLKQYAADVQIHVLNPELLHHDYEEIEELIKRCGTLAWDEASVLTHDTSSTYKMVQQLIEDHCKNVFMLTGTPVMNNVMEVYSLTKLIRPDLFRSKRDFRYRYMPRDKHRNWVTTGVANATELKSKINPIIFMRTPKDIKGEVPESTTSIIPVELNKQQKEIYERLKVQAKQELKQYHSVDSSERYQVVNNVLAIITKMKQTCNAIGLDPNPKLEKMLTLMGGDLLNDKLIVFSQYEKSVFEIRDRFNKEHIEHTVLTGSVTAKKRVDAVTRFQADSTCRALLMTTAGGMGLNITKASGVILFDLLWNPQMIKQIVGRAIRYGNTTPCVSIINLLMMGTIEERILCTLANKDAMFDAIMSKGGEAILNKPTIKQLEALLD